MKKIAFALLFALTYSYAAFAENTNTGTLTVSQIKGNQSEPTVYRYSFSGDTSSAPSYCFSSFNAKSGDTNNVQLLQLAYITGISVKIGIPDGCTITTVELQ
jgi:hypothetical protein